MRSPLARGESPALHPGRFDLVARMAARLPGAWLANRRRRRLHFLALAAPGFFAVFGTSLHRNLLVALVGFLLFAAAVVFRLRTEPAFEAAGATTPPPNPDPTNPTLEETRHA